MFEKLNHDQDNQTSEAIRPVTTSIDVGMGIMQNESNNTCETLHSSPSVIEATGHMGFFVLRIGRPTRSTIVNSSTLYRSCWVQCRNSQ